ncbi:MAG: biotin--[acetyl-CoA-carboxylase] ligase [Kiritimatiellae bacterium]|nr:biotin--[acetyl-CoA-carboxylase] ligase [Kiritimatiellia bacterium]
MSTGHKILELLESQRGDQISSSAICERLRISRSAVWKHIQSLRGQGYQIEARTRCGYRLIASADRPDAVEVLPLLRTKTLGRELHYQEVTASTNRDAAAAAEAGGNDGMVFCAGEQSQGRGRMSRTWFSPPGVNLYFSMLLRPAVATDLAMSLPLVVGLAVAEAIKDLAPELEPRVKWPNDILINGRKVCGILCEMQAQIDCGVRYIIAGAGVNVNLEREILPAELRSTATSLKAEAGRALSCVELLAGVLNIFERHYGVWQRAGFKPLAGLMERYDALAGAEVTVRQGELVVSGQACGVQDDGALKIETPQGIVAIYSGEATLKSARR